jgi:hypothetical protein
MVLDVEALPDCSDAEGLAKATGKMLVMRDGFKACDLAWVAVRVDGKREGQAKDAAALLILEKHDEYPWSGHPVTWEAVRKDLVRALKKAKAAHWDPADVVYVYKSTRPIEHESDYMMSRDAKYKVASFRQWNSTNAVLLCGEKNLGRYLGPMLWGSLAAGEALRSAAST